MTQEFKIGHPIKGDDGREIALVQVRRAQVKDIEIMQEEASQLKQSIRLLSLLAELSTDEVRRMDAADFSAITEGVSDFLE